MPIFLCLNCYSITASSTEIKETARKDYVKLPLLLAMEGVPREFIEHATLNQQAVMLQIVQDRQKDLKDLMTSAVWGIFAKK